MVAVQTVSDLPGSVMVAGCPSGCLARPLSLQVGMLTCLDFQSFSEGENVDKNY